MSLDVATATAQQLSQALKEQVISSPELSDMRLLRIAELLDSAAGPGFTAPPVGIRS
jgi:hypothetical protein